MCVCVCRSSAIAHIQLDFHRCSDGASPLSLVALAQLKSLLASAHRLQCVGAFAQGAVPLNFTLHIGAMFTTQVNHPQAWVVYDQRTTSIAIHLQATALPISSPRWWKTRSRPGVFTVDFLYWDHATPQLGRDLLPNSHEGFAN